MTDSLSQQSDECFNIDKHNFQESLPRLKDFLREADRHVQLRAVKTLLGPCVALCSPHQLGKTLLDDAAPVARRLFFETINEVEDLVPSTTFALDDVKVRLECCESLMESWLHCLALLRKIDKLSASQVRGVLDNIVEVIKRSFEHCKASEELYGDSFLKLKEKLTILFRKTNEVQKTFYFILERVIVFNNDVEAELSALAKVVRFSGENCFLVNGLDMKSVAESWKGFTRIAIPYCDDLKMLSPPCVTPHLVSLADLISSAISSIVKDPDPKSAERSIRLQRLLLKILHKLCLSYSGHLGDDAASAVIRLLVQLHRYSPSCLKTLNVHLEIVDCIEANFTSRIDQFLDIVIGDAEFREAYFRYQSNQKSGDIGLHLLTLLLIKKLIVSSCQIQPTWCRYPHHILEVTFHNISSLEEELFVGQLRLEVLPLYDATLTSICGLVVSARDLDYQSFEIILLKNLLGGHFWSSILASDVWCFVDRYVASSDLTYDHLTYLMSVYEILANRGTCMENVILGNLITRLYNMSSSESRNRLIDNFEISKARFWAPLKGCMSPSDKTFLSEMTSRDAEKRIGALWECLDKQPSTEVWTSLMNQLSVIATFGKSDNQIVLKTVNEIWNCLDKSIDEFDGIHLHLVTKLAINLLDATQALQNEEEDIHPILSTLTSLVPRSVPHLRANVSHYLKESTDNFAESGPEMIATLAKLYCSLLDDGNPFSQEEALDSFAHTTNVSYNEQLVNGIVDGVAEVPQIGEVVSLYLSHTAPGSQRGFQIVENYLRELLRRCQITGSHVCLDRGESRRDEKRRKLVIDAPIMRPGTPEDLRELLQRLSNDFDHVLSRRKEMSESSLHKLKIIVNKVIRDNGEM